MTSQAFDKDRNSSLFPYIRLVSLKTMSRAETPLCPPDPLTPRCSPDPPIPICLPDPPCLCIADLKPRCATVSCVCDCVGDCACDFHCSCHFYVKPPCPCDPVHHCYCVSKGGKSPDNSLPPESCEAHARTFFRLSRNED